MLFGYNGYLHFYSMIGRNRKTSNKYIINKRSKTKDKRSNRMFEFTSKFVAFLINIISNIYKRNNPDNTYYIYGNRLEVEKLLDKKS